MLDQTVFKKQHTLLCTHRVQWLWLWHGFEWAKCILAVFGPSDYLHNVIVTSLSIVMAMAAVSTVMSVEW